MKKPITDIRWQDVKLLATDCDGVLTDGGVYMDSMGAEMRRFHIHDGHGMRSLMKQGVVVAIISAAKSQSIKNRGKQLGISETHTAVSDKAALVKELAAKYDTPLSQVAFVGDDVVDLGPLSIVGFPISVSNGRPEAKYAAFYVTETPGGHGAIREICDLILAAQLPAHV